MKNNSVNLSVVVPVYNAEEYLYENILSIINQKLPYIPFYYEIILVDDGSEDSSREICKKLESQYAIVRFIMKNNGGVSSARNAGISAARGEYISFVDSDDKVSNEYIKTISELVMDNPELGVFSNYRNKSGKSTIVKKSVYSQEGLISLEQYQRLLFAGNSNEPWDKVFSGEIIRNKEIRFNENVDLGEDLIFTISYLPFVNKIAYSDKAIYFYNESSNGLSKRKSTQKGFNDVCFLIKRIYEYTNNYTLENTINQMAYEYGLQMITNIVGKITQAGISTEYIDAILLNEEWYKKIINHKYTSVKSLLRQFLMKQKMYSLIAIIFRK